MFDQNTELNAAQQWSTIRQNQEYQRAFDEIMALLLALPLDAREIILSTMERQ